MVLQIAAAEIEKKAQSIDYLICNAAYISSVTVLRNLTDLFVPQIPLKMRKGKLTYTQHR